MNILHFSARTLGVAAFALGCASASSAMVVDVSLGESAELLTLYGLGPVAPGSPFGTFAIGQGSSTFDGVTSTFILSGNIASGTPGYGSGTYQFITTYAGADTPMAGPNAPTGRTNANNLLQFNYRSIDPTTTIKLILNTPLGMVMQDLFKDDNFVPGVGWNFQRTSTTCTGVALCTQNNVGLTPGATIYGPVTIGVRFEVPDAPAVPEPASWAMMIGGFGLLGGMMRRRAVHVALA